MQVEIVNRDTDPIPQNRNFVEMLRGQWAKGHFISVGLDPDPERVPPTISVLDFNKSIIDATIDLAGAYKPNSAFYEERGASGIQMLIDTIAYIHEKDPSIPVILDAKRGDIGSTMSAYARYSFDTVGADAVTAHPYLGKEALKPLLERKDKGVIVLVRTSNKGAGEFQDFSGPDGEPLYLNVARHVAEWNEEYGNCALVVGATYPDDIKLIRQAVPSLPFLIPGIGTQGGDHENAVRNGRDANNQGFILNSSSGIIFASSPRTELEALTNMTNQFRMAA